MRNAAVAAENRGTAPRSGLVNNAQPISISGPPTYDSNVWSRRWSPFSAPKHYTNYTIAPPLAHVFEPHDKVKNNFQQHKIN